MKKTLLASMLCILTLSIPSVAQLANYTLADVAKHTTPADCWIILNSTEVYNVSAYISPTSQHPGGLTAISSLCGADATAAFNGLPHNATGIAKAATYLIGNLVATTIGVTISPPTVSLTPTQQQMFVATVSNSSMGVKWSATSAGTIDQNGQYTAVAPGTGTVTATSLQDTTKSATAQVTVAAVPPTGGIAVTISPTNSSVAVGGTQQFTANVTGSTAGANWTATGAVGTVDNNGMFKASTAGQGIVKATSAQDPAMSASAAVTVTQSGAACSVAANQSGFSITCPAGMVPPNRYSCVVTAGSPTIRCTSRRGGQQNGGQQRGDD